MRGGYVGKLLDVDLSKGEIKEQNLPSEEVLRSYVGCFGLGLKILYDELPPGTAPLDPENPLIFLTGPLTATSVPCATNTTLTTLNYDTGYTVGRSHTHGFLGPNLKFAGYDGLIIRGKAEKPVCLWIEKGKTEIRDAGAIWGKDTHETEEYLKEKHNNPRMTVASIGPAGENLCVGALIANDRNHSLSHSGGGAIMGSKKLKAICVYGKGEMPLVREERFKKAAKEWRHALRGDTIGWHHRNASIPRDDYRLVKKVVGLSAKNWQTSVFPEFGENMSIQKITPKACWRCPIACAYDVEVVSGPYKGYVASLCGGGEAMEGAAAMIGIGEVGAIFYLTDLYDRLGLEASTAGCTISLAFECYEKGLITKKDTDGLELRWGDAKAAEKLLRKLAYREGIGEILALGPKRAAEMIGKDAAKFAVHIKGTGMNLHDWRSAWGVLFGQIIGGGSGWPSPGADCWAPEPDVGYPERQNPMTPKGKAEAARKTGMKKHWNADCLGICWYGTWGVPGITYIAAEALSSATGWDFSQNEGLEVGERILNLERVFNVRRGLRPEDDLDVSPRILDPAPDGPAKGKTIKPYLKGMVSEYYRLMGWDEKTGRPWRSTLKRLGLEEVIPHIWS